MNDPGSGIEQGFPCVFASEVRSHIHSTKEQRIDTRTRPGNVKNGFKPCIHLDDDMKTGIVTALGQQIIKPNHFIRRHHLRQHQCRRRRICRKNRLDIIKTHG